MKLNSITREAADCRKAWQAAPDATWGWHIHHERLAERLSEPIENRIAYILREKPKEERALRLWLMRPVSPEGAEAVASAQAAYDKATAPARAAYEKATASARAAYNKAFAPAEAAYDKALASAEAAYKKATASAEAAYKKATASAEAAYEKATASARAAYEKAVAPSHATECVPDCPWNGRTIFGKET